VLVVSYTVIEEKVSDPTFDPIPERVSIRQPDFEWGRITGGYQNS
jgi:hypothetical protein